MGLEPQVETFSTGMRRALGKRESAMAAASETERGGEVRGMVDR